MRVGILFCALFISLNVIAGDRLVFSSIEGSINSDISQEVLELAYEKLGIKIETVPLPGERALLRSNSGEVDGELFRIGNLQKRYPNLVQVPTAINVLEGVAFTKGNTVGISGWDSIRSYRIGIQRGIKFSEKGTQGMNPVVVDTNEQLFKMLHAGRVEIAVAAHVNGLVTLQQLKMKHIHANKPAIQTFPLYHYLHKKHADLVDRLDAVLKNMQESGVIAKIREQTLSRMGNQ